MLRLRITVIAVSLAIAFITSGCGTDSSEDDAASTTTTAGQRGGPGGGGQTFTAVNLNTNGDSPGGANTAAVADAANAFLASLDTQKRDTVTFDFSDNQSRQTWSNFPSTAVPRKGIKLADLSADQQKAALTILDVALSADGAQQDDNIQKSDDELNRLGGQGADGFGALVDYYIAVYGTPSATSPFGIQFGGHHLARNLTYNGDKVSQTPQFVGTEPTSFQADGATVEPLKAESTAMFGTVAALSDDQRKSAEITSGTFDDLVMGPGKDTGVFPASEGLLVSQLNDSQKTLVTTAIQTYVGDLNTEAATKVMSKYQSELDQTRVGWSNNTSSTGENSYIRIDGPSVWIEFINTRSMSTPNIHFHSVYRDKTNDYGSTKPS